MAGLDFSLFYAFECPVSEKRAALPRQNPKTGRRVEADFAASATGGKVRDSDIAPLFVTVRSCAKRPFMVGTFKVSLETSASRTLSVTLEKDSDDRVEPKAEVLRL